MKRFVALLLPFVLSFATRASAEPPSKRALEMANAAMERGAKLAEGGDDEHALVEFRSAQELVPSANLPWRYAAESLERLSRYEEAIEAYNRYLQLKPDVKDGPLVVARIAALERTSRRPAAPTIAIEKPAPQKVEDKSWSKHTWGFVTLAAGGLLLGGTATSDALFLGDARRDFERARDAGDGNALAESERFETTRAFVIAGYAASAAALAVGAVLLLWPKAEKTGIQMRSSGFRIRF